jgi:hypothetical protein
MTKPVIVKRSTKGSHLTFTELDNNFQNLDDATITLRAGSAGTSVASDLNGTITLVASDGISLTGNNSTKEIAIDASVLRDTSPQLGANLDVNGYKIISVSNGNIELDPDGTGKVIISGDLQVDGTTTTINSTTVDIDDKNITLAKGAINAAAADGGGITLEGPTTSATILYTSSTDSWNFNKLTTFEQDVTFNASIKGPANSPVVIAPDGTGDVHLNADSVRIGDNNSNATIATRGTGDLIITTNEGSATEGIIRIYDGANGNITVTPNGTGNLVLDGVNWPQADGTSNQYLRTNGSGQLTWATPAGGITDVVNDTSPQLGGDLDVNGFKLTSTSNGFISLIPNGTGAISMSSNSAKATLSVGSNTGTRVGWSVTDSSTKTMTSTTDKDQWTIFNDLSHGIVFSGVNANPYINITSRQISLTSESGYNVQIDGNKFPRSLGTANYFLKTDGAGNLSWSSVSSGAISNVVEDTTPQLGGDLDVNTFKLTSTSNGDIVFDPNGTGYVRSKAQYLMVGETGATSSFVYTQDNTAESITFGHGSGSSITAYKTGSGGLLVFAAAGDDIFLDSTRIRASRLNTAGVITTNGTGSLTLQTNNAGTNSGKILIAEGTNGNISVTPNGTGKSVLTNINYNETIYDLGTTGGTIAPNVTNGNIQKITLNSALTLNAFTTPVTGQSLTLMIFGGTAYTSITSTMKFAGGIKTLTATAGCVDIVSIFYDGTNYYASLGKGFA